MDLYKKYDRSHKKIEPWKSGDRLLYVISFIFQSAERQKEIVECLAPTSIRLILNHSY